MASFAFDVKKELCAVTAADGCCTKAEACGLALCGGSFAWDDIHIQTDNLALARRYQKLISAATGENVALSDSGAGLSGAAAGRAYSLLGGGMPADDCCAAAFLRGAFLSGGHITNPERDYHMEWTFSEQTAARQIAAAMNEMGYPARIVERGIWCVYFKDSTVIEDLLVLMGAPQSAFRLMDVKIIKDVRNNSNRITNCDTANINKTVRAAAEQLAAIEVLRQSGRLDMLDEQLLAAARLRGENPEAPLSELSAISGLSKSHISRRLNILIKLSEEAAT